MADLSPLLRRRWARALFSRGGVLTTAVGLVFALFSFATDFLSVRSLWSDRSLPAELEPRLAGFVRQVHREHPRPGAGRERGLTAAVARFAETNLVHIDEARPAAIELLRRIDLAEESIERGIGLAREKRYEPARHEFASATQVDPESAAAWSNLAAASALVGKLDEARAAYDRALVLDPQDWRVRYNFGLLFARTGNPREAVKHLAQALDSLRSAPGHERDLQAVHQELETDPGLNDLRRAPEFASLKMGG